MDDPRSDYELWSVYDRWSRHYPYLIIFLLSRKIGGMTEIIYDRYKYLFYQDITVSVPGLWCHPGSLRDVCAGSRKRPPEVLRGRHSLPPSQVRQREPLGCEGRAGSVRRRGGSRVGKGPARREAVFCRPQIMHGEMSPEYRFDQSSRTARMRRTDERHRGAMRASSQTGRQ